MTGRPPGNGNGLPEHETGGLARYFRFSLDHKVVGIQYLVGMLIYFCTAGLFAMAIRTELLSPVHHVFSSQAYVEIVGEHGTMMMMLMTSVIVGPFGNYLVPLMIGVQAGGVPPDRGAVVLADAGGLPHPAVRPAARRLPVRLDRVRAAVDPVHRRRRLVRGRVRADGRSR